MFLYSWTCLRYPDQVPRRQHVSSKNYTKYLDDSRSENKSNEFTIDLFEKHDAHYNRASYDTLQHTANAFKGLGTAFVRTTSFINVL